MSPPKCPHCGAQLGGMGFVELEDDDDDDDDDELGGEEMLDDDGPE